MKARILTESEVFPCTECHHRAEIVVETLIWPGHKWFLCATDAAEFGATIEDLVDEICVPKKTKRVVY